MSDQTIVTKTDDQDALDIDRRLAEINCTDAAYWFELAERYEAFGKGCQAESCRRRAEYYQQEGHNEPI